MSDDSRSRSSRTTADRAAAARDALGRAHLGRASLGRVTPQPGANAGRRAQVAIAVFAAIGIGVAYGNAVSPAAGAPSVVAASKPTPVRLATVICPEVVGTSDVTVGAISPTVGGMPAQSGSATVTSLGKDTPLFTLKQTGVLSSTTGLSGDTGNIRQESIPVIGQASGGYAPGFTVTETLSNSASQHGLASTDCTAPDTDFWYLGAEPGAKTATKVNFFDSDQIAAQVNVSAFTPNGPVGAVVAQSGQGRLVPSGNQGDPLDLGGFNADGTPMAVHVVTTAGRVGAALLDSEGPGGRDFILAQKPATHLLLPGVPAANPGSAMKLQLFLLSPNVDSDVTLHWIGGSRIKPTVTVPHLTADHVESVDISGVPAAGEAGALQVDSGGAPVLAEIKVTTGSGSDIAYVSPVPPLAGESLVADDNPGSVVELTNAGAKDAQVQVTAEGTGAPAPQTVTVPARSTKAVTVPGPQGAAGFAISVDPLGGADAVYAARVMTANGGLITIQPMSTALETVLIPAVRSDLSGTVPQ